MQFQLKNGQMFDTDYPACPTCGGEMWDNRNNKKNPKQPDFRCKNQDCKDEKGFQTGVYLPKPKGQAPAARPAPARPAPAAAKPAAPAATAAPRPAPVAPVAPKPAGGRGDYGNSVPLSMFGAWAMNLVVALVGQGKVSTVAEGVAAYKEALKGVGDAMEGEKAILDAKLPSNERQVPVAPAKPAAAPSKPAQAAPAPVAPAVEEQPTSPEDIQFDPAAETPVADPLDAVAGGVEEISMEDLSNVDI